MDLVVQELVGLVDLSVHDLVDLVDQVVEETQVESKSLAQEDSGLDHPNNFSLKCLYIFLIT